VIRIETGQHIPEQANVPWSTAFVVSWNSLKRRLGRSIVTMIGVILAIAFLAYMLINNSITFALIAAQDDKLSMLLQERGVDIYSEGETDSMTILLICLALITCLVGIVNSMLMSVTERVKEIGTLKCLGAMDFFILQSYFIESSLQGVLGTIVGIFLGAFVAVGTALLGYKGFVFPYFPWVGVLWAMSLSFLIGSLISVVASIAPAYWAARKEPVEAMRVEE
jgi:ABC-type antimicrobial peptide transport system permease subunit